MDFSTGLRITGLNDFMGPAKDCIMPPPKPTKNEVEINPKDTPTKISLTDCLACSGCVTSAETVLIEQQGTEEFFKHLGSEDELIVLTISQQSIASIATKYNLSLKSAYGKLTTLFRMLGVSHVFETSVARDIGLVSAAEEFVSRKKQKMNNEDVKLPLITAKCPGWICYAEKTHGEAVLPYISKVKSSQQIMGSIVKRHLTDILPLGPQQKNLSCLCYAMF